ncbi:hypothetical protein HDU79_006843 [Rhizoclosmatium sp. JEL0117]|nr:hypothetical protein HDU79_006843 [Rhizoclosmatium sp. JEL0117]
MQLNVLFLGILAMSQLAAACVGDTYFAGSSKGCLPCATGTKGHPGGNVNYCDLKEGYYWKGPGKTNPTICPLGSVCDGNGSFDDCPVNSYCPQGTSAPGYCHQRPDDICPTTCQPFYDCNATKNNLCPENYVCPGGEARQCEAGSTNKAGKDGHTDRCDCQAGYFRPAPGDDGAPQQCQQCDGTGFCSGDETITVVTNSECDVGATSFTSCHCKANTYLSKDKSSCTACPDGSTSPAASTDVSQCVAIVCNPGQYIKDTACADCPAGNQCDGKKSTPCAAGFYSDTDGAQFCSFMCPEPGTPSYPFGPWLQFCTSTAIGSTSPDTNSCETGCTAPQVQYGDNVCTDCKPGTTYSVRWSTCQPCGTGYFGAGSGTCAKCPAGSYTDIDEATECTLCPENTFSTTVGGKSNSVCKNCPAGTWSDRGASKCTSGVKTTIAATSTIILQSTVASAISTNAGTALPDSTSTAAPTSKDTAITNVSTATNTVTATLSQSPQTAVPSTSGTPSGPTCDPSLPTDPTTNPSPVNKPTGVIADLAALPSPSTSPIAFQGDAVKTVAKMNLKVPAALGSVNASSIASSLFTITEPVVPGTPVSFKGSDIPTPTTPGINAVVLLLSSTQYAFDGVPTSDKILTYNAASSASVNVALTEDGGVSITYTLPNYILSEWYILNLRADGKTFDVVANTGSDALISVTFQIHATGGKRRDSGGFTIVTAVAPVVAPNAVVVGTVSTAVASVSTFGASTSAGTDISFVGSSTVLSAALVTTSATLATSLATSGSSTSASSVLASVVTTTLPSVLSKVSPTYISAMGSSSATGPAPTSVVSAPSVTSIPSVGVTTVPSITTVGQTTTSSTSVLTTNKVIVVDGTTTKASINIQIGAASSRVTLCSGLFALFALLI